MCHHEDQIHCTVFLGALAALCGLHTTMLKQTRAKHRHKLKLCCYHRAIAAADASLEAYKCKSDICCVLHVCCVAGTLLLSLLVSSRGLVPRCTSCIGQSSHSEGEACSQQQAKLPEACTAAQAIFTSISWRNSC